jgi:hypothetical protein
MKIEIAETLKPYSHLPGAACIVPGTATVITAYPTLIQIGNYEIKLNITGPVSEFMLQQDLEKHLVHIFGKAKEGYFHLEISRNDAGFDVFANRVPAKGLSTSKGTLNKKEKLHIPSDAPFIAKAPFERLSLGNHKAQDFDQIQKRSDLREWLPLLFTLGQKLPRILPQPINGTARLLEMPNDRSQLPSALEALFKAAFTKILVPQLNDEHYHGVITNDGKGNPFFLVQEAAKLIRGLFFVQNERRIYLLPNLPIPLDCGRMLNIQAPGIGTIDFEWTKKQLRRVIIRATTPGNILLEYPTLSSFRVRTSMRQKGHRATETLLLEAGKTYYLDNFRK